jgi:hypothetical protein
MKDKSKQGFFQTPIAGVLSPSPVFFTSDFDSVGEEHLSDPLGRANGGDRYQHKLS